MRGGYLAIWAWSPLPSISTHQISHALVPIWVSSFGKCHQKSRWSVWPLWSNAEWIKHSKALALFIHITNYTTLAHPHHEQGYANAYRRTLKSCLSHASTRKHVTSPCERRFTKVMPKSCLFGRPHCERYWFKCTKFHNTNQKCKNHHRILHTFHFTSTSNHHHNQNQQAHDTCN